QAQQRAELGERLRDRRIAGRLGRGVAVGRAAGAIRAVRAVRAVARRLRAFLLLRPGVLDDDLVGVLLRARPLLLHALADLRRARRRGLLDQRAQLVRRALAIELGAQQLERLLAELGIGELIDDRVDRGRRAAAQQQLRDR